MNDLFYLGVKAVIRNHNGQVLLLKAKDYWDLPGGRLQVGETEVDALKREISEETGLEVTGVLGHLGMCVASARLTQPDGKPAGLIFSVYICEVAPGDIVISNEHLSFDWMPPTRAAQQIAGKFSPQICAAIAKL